MPMLILGSYHCHIHHLCKGLDKHLLCRNFGLKMASNTSADAFERRTAEVKRVTNETKIEVSLSLDTHPTLAPQIINVKTGIGFLDHVSRLADDKLFNLAQQNCN